MAPRELELRPDGSIRETEDPMAGWWRALDYLERAHWEVARNETQAEYMAAVERGWDAR